MPTALIVTAAGINCDLELAHAFELAGASAELVHLNTLLARPQLMDRYELIGIPGGFSYGDYLRTGAVAHLAPIMRAVKRHAANDGLVLGICNGFQILLESGLLPGGILRNSGLKFICRFVNLRVERADTPFTHRFKPGQVVRMPIAHNEGLRDPRGSGAGRPDGR